MKNIKSTLVAVLVILALMILIVILPFAVIWALNTLFPVLAIPLAWQTWLSVIVLLSAVKFSVK
jgi:hypothetical protein